MIKTINITIMILLFATVSGFCDFDDAVFYPAGDYPNSVTAADFNGDNFNDLASANSDSYNMSVFINNGDGTFQAAANYPAGIHPFQICIVSSR